MQQIGDRGRAGTLFDSRSDGYEVGDDCSLPLGTY